MRASAVTGVQHQPGRGRESRYRNPAVWRGLPGRSCGLAKGTPSMVPLQGGSWGKRSCSLVSCCLLWTKPQKKTEDKRAVDVKSLWVSLPGTKRDEKVGREDMLGAIGKYLTVALICGFFFLSSSFGPMHSPACPLPLFDHHCYGLGLMTRPKEVPRVDCSCLRRLKWNISQYSCCFLVFTFRAVIKASQTARRNSPYCLILFPFLDP